MRAVNLLPRDERGPRLEGLRLPLLAVAASLVVFTLAGAMLARSASSVADSRRAELATVEAELARLARAPRPVVTQGTLVRERADRTTALAAALSTRVAFDRLLREVSLLLPEDAWLTSVSAAAPTGSGSSRGSGSSSSSDQSGVTIQGTTYSHESVARVLSRLSAAPSLENVRLASSSRLAPARTTGPDGEPTESSGPRVVTFTVSASLRSREGS